MLHNASLWLAKDPLADGSSQGPSGFRTAGSGQLWSGHFLSSLVDSSLRDSVLFSFSFLISLLLSFSSFHSFSPSFHSVGKAERVRE